MLSRDKKKLEILIIIAMYHDLHILRLWFK